MGMKRRYLAVLMGIMVATTSVPAMVYAEDSKTETAADAANDESGEADASGESSDESQENMVLGEVKSVSDSEITIAVGTMKEMGQPGGDGQNGGASEKPEGDGQNSDSSDGASDSQDAADDNQESENTDSQDGEEPEKPDGNGQSAEAEEISLSDIQEGDIVSITLDEDGNAASITVMSMEMGGQGQPGGDGQGASGQGGPDGQSQGVDSYTAVNEYIEDTTVSNEPIESTGTDENAALISSGANVIMIPLQELLQTARAETIPASMV